MTLASIAMVISTVGAAIGLQHVAIDSGCDFTHRLEVDDRPQRPPDEPLDLERAAALFAARGLAPGTVVGCPRQHAVLRRDPALAAAAQPAGHALLDRGCAQHMGIAATGQYRALCVFGEMAQEFDLAQLVRRTTTGAHE